MELHFACCRQTSQKSAFAQADLPTLQVALTKQGMPPKALQAIRMLLASHNLYSSHSVADFEKQIDPLHEETCLQVGTWEKVSAS